jgi:hypothetical protein
MDLDPRFTLTMPIDPETSLSDPQLACDAGLVL